MMSFRTDFEHAKFEALVGPNFVSQISNIPNSTSGQRQVQEPVSTIWHTERLLARGASGEVRVERCVATQRLRAVKRIWQTGSRFQSKYERELKALLEFSKPKHKRAACFVEFYGWFQDLDNVYLAMEYVALGDLEEYTGLKGGMIEEKGVREIATQILNGLRIMHQENFIHRDLKPKVGYFYFFFRITLLTDD